MRTTRVSMWFVLLAAVSALPARGETAFLRARAAADVPDEKREVLARDVYAQNGKPRRLVEAVTRGRDRTVRVTVWGLKDQTVSVSTWLNGQATSLTVSKVLATGPVSTTYSEPRAAQPGDADLGDALKLPLKTSRFQRKEVTTVKGDSQKIEAFARGADGSFVSAGARTVKLATLN